MSDLQNLPQGPADLVLDNLTLPEVVRTRAVSTTQRDTVDGYLGTLLRTGRLQELGNAYTESGQHAGVPAWRPIVRATATNYAQNRIDHPVIAELIQAIGDDMVRRV